MPIDLYMMPPSAPCRSVMMLGKALKLDMNWKQVDMLSGEHTTPQFIKMNPQHTVPTLDDNGFYLWESRSILMYLADKYDNSGTFYPKDPQARAHVNRFLFFDMEKVYGKLGPYIYPIVFHGKEPTEETENPMKESFDQLDKFLEGKKYITGDNLTLADFSIASSVAFLEPIKYDITAWKNLNRFMSEMKKLPYWNECNKGLEILIEFAKEVREKRMNNK